MLLDSELQMRVYRDATRITNTLSPLRRGYGWSEDSVLEVLSAAQTILYDLIHAVSYPQLVLWKGENANTSQDQTESNHQT